MPTSPATNLTRSGLLGTVVVLLVAAGCVRLGLWQLDRLQQRRQANAVMEQRVGLEPIELSGAPTDTTGLDFRAARLLGVWDHDRSMAYAARSRGGVPGVHVLTPLRTEDGRAVLVNRGFVPAPDAATVALEPLRATGAASVVGRLRALPTQGGQGSLRDHADSLGAMPTWFALSLGGIEEHVPYAIAPLYLIAEERTGPDPYPAPARAPEPDEGPHLGYALQWFSFAVIAVVGWVALLAKGGAARGRGHGRLADPKEHEA